MSDLKTRASGKSVTAFLAGIRDPEVRKDCRTLARLMKKVTKARPVMWGASVPLSLTGEGEPGSGRQGRGLPTTRFTSLPRGSTAAESALLMTAS